jgi:hypothetical protein
MALGAGYLVYTVNSIVMFCIKLEFVTDLLNTGQLSGVINCPEGYTQFDTTPFCMEIAKVSIPASIKPAGLFNEVLLYLMVLLSDGLLVSNLFASPDGNPFTYATQIYRCHILLETRRLIFAIACSPLLISFSKFILLHCE